MKYKYMILMMMFLVAEEDDLAEQVAAEVFLKWKIKYHNTKFIYLY